MQVRFFADLRSITGCAEADVPYAETAGALIRSLCGIYGEKLEEKFNEEIIVLINGQHMNRLGGYNAPLKPEDRVDIFPVVTGG